MTTPPDPERRRVLLSAKLRGLVRAHWPDVEVPEPRSAGGGVAVEAGGRTWALPGDEDAEHGFARALLWALHHDAAELHVLLDDGPGVAVAARQAAAFRRPVTVWAVRGTALHRAEGGALPPEPEPDPRTLAFRPVIEGAGADVVTEWGALTGEVLGIPVATTGVDERGPWLEVGIGKHDRLVNRMRFGDAPSGDALAQVVDRVLEARRSGDDAHPLNRLCRERWLRRRLVGRPDLVGMTALTPVAPPRPADDLRAPLLAPALAGDGTLVAVSVGFDARFVPTAAELHAARAPDAPLVLVVPEGDVHPLTRAAAAGLRVPAEIRTVPDDWAG